MPNRGLDKVLTEAKLRHWYLDKRMSMEEIGAIVGCTCGGVAYYIHRYGIPARTSNKDWGKTLTEKNLRRWYLGEGMSSIEIATEMGCSTGAVNHYMHKYDIPFRTRKQAQIARLKRGKNIYAPKREKSPNWRGGRRKDRGYIEIYDPDHPKARMNGYIFEHTLVWEEHHGELPSGWHIHHLNGIKDDNRVENLKGLPSKKHLVYLKVYRERIKELEDRVKELEERLTRYKGGTNENLLRRAGSVFLETS